MSTKYISITCLRCQKTSYNQADIENLYCVYCGDYHEKDSYTRKKNVRGSQDMKYIQRIDRPDKCMHLWVVNISITAKGLRINKTFTDLKGGGKPSGLLAATAFRGRMVKVHGLTLDSEYRKQPFVTDKEGIYTKYKHRGNKSTPYAVACWTETSKGVRVRKYKHFNMEKYGEKRAMRLARKFRKDKLKELYE